MGTKNAGVYGGSSTENKVWPLYFSSIVVAKTTLGPVKKKKQALYSLNTGLWAVAATGAKAAGPTPTKLVLDLSLKWRQKRLQMARKRKQKARTRTDRGKREK